MRVWLPAVVYLPVRETAAPSTMVSPVTLAYSATGTNSSPAASSNACARPGMVDTVSACAHSVVPVKG